MRGSSLVYPPVLEALRPFIVTYASARTVEDFPDDVRELCGPAGQRPRNINLGLMVLDADGKPLRQMMPFIKPPAFHFDPEAQGRDFKRQVDQMLAGLSLPRAKTSVTPKLALPDVTGNDPFVGVRIYLSFAANKMNHYRTPTVEAVATTRQVRESLRYPNQPVSLKAEALRPWLEQIYPPAVMDGQGGFERIDATFQLRPAGRSGETRYALLEGDANFTLDNKTRINYSGKLTAVVEYRDDSPEPQRVRGVCECIVPKQNPQGQVMERIRMTAAIESRPR